MADNATKAAAGPRRRGAGRPFQPGQSGNPAGCRSGSRHRTTRLLDTMAEGEAEAVLRTLIDAAKNGDARAAETILRRVWPEPKGRAISVALAPAASAGELSGALAQIMAHVAEGRLTPVEAQQIASLIETQRKMVETVELAARLDEIESQVSASKDANGSGVI